MKKGAMTSSPTSDWHSKLWVTRGTEDACYTRDEPGTQFSDRKGGRDAASIPVCRDCLGGCSVGDSFRRHGGSAGDRPTETPPIPPGLDWDTWLGPAPYAPYCPARIHYNWRWILDYSGGQITDWAHHIIDIAQWGNDTEDTWPIEVEGAFFVKDPGDKPKPQA